MYGSPAGRTGPQSTVVCIAAAGCLGMVLFLIAATIVLALIPVFTSNNSVPANPNAFRSQNIIMSIEVEDATNQGKRRRKRDVVSLDSAVGGSLDTTGNDNIKTKFLAALPSTTRVSSLEILSCTFGYKPLSRRKRLALSKRAKRASSNAIVLVCEFYIIFQFSCSYNCQSKIGPTIRSTLYSIPLSSFVFTNVGIYKNGAPFGTITIQFITLVYVSQILPGTSSATPAPATVTVTLSTTSATSTPSLG